MRQLAIHVGTRNDTRLPGRVVAVVGARRGVGATTTSVNLSIALTRLDASVTLIDADFDQPEADRQCGLSSRYTLKDLLEGTRTMREIQQVGPAGLRLLPGSSIEFDPTIHRIAPLVDPLATLADWVVVDCGQGLGFSEIYRRADDLVIVTTSTSESVMEAYAAIKQTAGNLTAGRFWLIVSQTNELSLAEDVQRRIALSCDRFLNLPIHAAVSIPVDSCVREADRMNRPVLLQSPTSPLSLAMEKLASELARTSTKVKSTLAVVSPPRVTT